MSGNAMRDVLTVSEFEKQSENFLKENLPKPFYADSTENFDNLHNVNSASFTAPQLNGFGVKSNEAEVGNAEVEYVETENLTDLLSADIALKTLVARLDSKDWVALCEALNNVRQLSIFHKEDFSELLGNVIPRIVKSLKSPRSAVCKTAVMTSADIFKVYKDLTIDFLDPLLVQLLLKSSQDKRFVCEASEKALIAMTTCISPSLLLPKLQPYLKDKNPRIRAKASMCFSRIFPRLGVEEIQAYGINELIRIASAQLSDQLPESREAARSLALQLRTFYEKSQPSLSSGKDKGDPSETFAATTLPWEDFCHSQLSALSAQAILRVT